MLKKIANVELLRIVLLLSIVLFHAFGSAYFGCFGDIFSYSNISKYTRNGYLAADGFFILAGFFLYYKFNFELSLKNFIAKKYLRLILPVAAVLFCYLIFSLFDFGEFVLKNNILTLFLINGLIPSGEITNCGHLWFVSVYFWAEIFYFSFLKFLNSKSTFFVILTTALCGGFLAFWGLENIPRGLFCMGLGILLSVLYRKFNFGNLGGKFFKFLMVISAALLIWTLFCTSAQVNYFYFILVFLFALFAFLTAEIPFLNTPAIQRAAGLSYPIFIFHIPLLTLYKKTIIEHYPNFIQTHPLLNIAIYLVILYIAGEMWEKFFMQIKRIKTFNGK